MKRFKGIYMWILNNKLITFIILCMFFLRLWRIADFAMFLADQGRDAIIIRKIVTFEHFPLIGPPSSIGQVYLGPFFYYLVAPFLILFFFNPVGLAYGVSILSIIGLLFAYIVLKKELKLKTAFIFLLFSTFSYQLIWYARFAWNPNLLPFFTFFTLYFLYQALHTKKLTYSLLYGIFFALSFQLHHLAAFLVVPIAIAYLYQFFIDKHKKNILSTILPAFLAFFAITSPLIIFDLKHDFLNTKNLSSLFAHQNVVAGGSPILRLSETSHAFWQVILQIQIPEIASTILSICFVTTIIALFVKKRLPFLVFIHAVNTISFIYLFSLLSSPRHPHYYGSTYLSFYCVIAYLFTYITQKKRGRIVIFIVMTFYLILNIKMYYFIAGPSQNQIKHAETVANSIVPYIKNKPFNFATYPVEFTSEETFLYFLVNKRLHFADREAREVTDQMYVLCDREPCNILKSQSWNVDMFGKAKIDTMWEIEGVKIFRLIHDRN